MKSFIKNIFYRYKWVYISSWVLLKGNNIKIWKWTYINGPNTILHSGKKSKIEIWNYCSISWWVSIIAKNKHDYRQLSTSWLFMRKYSSKIRKDIWDNVTIGNDVWIWAGCVILPGIKIGDWSIIWAGSVVTKNIEEYSIYAGNPAEFIKPRFNKNIVKKLKLINWNEIDIHTIQHLEQKYGL